MTVPSIFLVCNCKPNLYTAGFATDIGYYVYKKMDYTYNFKNIHKNCIKCYKKSPKTADFMKNDYGFL